MFSDMHQLSRVYAMSSLQDLAKADLKAADKNLKLAWFYYTGDVKNKSQYSFSKTTTISPPFPTSPKTPRDTLQFLC